MQFLSKLKQYIVGIQNTNVTTKNILPTCEKQEEYVGGRIVEHNKTPTPPVKYIDASPTEILENNTVIKTCIDCNIKIENIHWKIRCLDCYIKFKNVTNNAIETFGPRDIKFRSRLEATWAYFFDEVNFDWEYEPIDLIKYIPDFILRFGDELLLVEIKPELTIRNMEKHADKIISSGWKDNFIILGAGFISNNNGKIFGLLYTFEKEWKYTPVYLCRINDRVYYTQQQNNSLENLENIWGCCLNKTKYIPNKKYTKQHNPNAYLPWTKDDDLKLLAEKNAGKILNN